MGVCLSVSLSLPGSYAREISTLLTTHTAEDEGGSTHHQHLVHAGYVVRNLHPSPHFALSLMHARSCEAAASRFVFYVLGRDRGGNCLTAGLFRISVLLPFFDSHIRYGAHTHACVTVVHPHNQLVLHLSPHCRRIVSISLPKLLFLCMYHT